MPGIPKNDPPYGRRMRNPDNPFESVAVAGFQKGHQKREAYRAERQKQIQDAMAKMPQLIAEYRVSCCYQNVHVV